MLDTLRYWLDSRTGYRALIRAVLYESMPRGTGWYFTTGSVVSFLLGLQVATGLVLGMYYVPSPALAYDSVRYIATELPLGWIVRGLHYWGASFIVVSALVHLLRVFTFGSYKAPREVTWMSGVVLLLLILTGYLLPWDQKAYWATTVTISIARSTPLLGTFLADVISGGAELGALTLGRWYSAHVFLLPLSIATFVVAHIWLMRAHGISGPITVQPGSRITFFPSHVVKDTLLISAVFALLVTVAVMSPASLDEIADPAASNYIPRPEWYFLSLFEMLKDVPGSLEPVATLVIPGAVVGFLFLLPFLDRSRDRRPFSPARRPFTIVVAALVLGAGCLTALALRDVPPRLDRKHWGPRALAGLTLATGPEGGCGTCHVEGGPAAMLSATRITRDDEWLLAHLTDPVAIAPGVQLVADAARPQTTRAEAQAMAAYFRRARTGAETPSLSAEDGVASVAFATTCIACHRIDGDGGDIGPDLSRVGERRSVSDLRSIIADPSLVFGSTKMPAYRDRLPPQQLEALAAFLAKRR
jgi:quinol-cytochrome oxidoreductase complex cytochrome b subunit